MDLLHVVKSRAGRNFVFKKVFPVLILAVVALFMVASIAASEKEARDSWTVIPVLVASCSILFIAYYFAREAPVLIINELSVLLDSEQKYFCYAQQNSVIWMEEIASVKSEAKQHLDNLQNANTREMRAQAIITTKWQLEKTRKLLLNAPEGRRVVCQKEFVELNHECHKLNLFLERFNCGAINIPSPQHISDLRGIVNRCTDEIENCYKKDLLDWSTKTKQSRLTIDEIGRVMRRIAS